MVEEMKEYILKYSSDEKSVLKMAEKVIKDYNLSENKQRLIVAILDYCGVSISEEDDILRNARIDCCIGSLKDVCFYVMDKNGIHVNNELKETMKLAFDFETYLDSTFCSKFIQFELEENIFGVVALSDL